MCVHWRRMARRKIDPVGEQRIDGGGGKTADHKLKEPKAACGLKRVETARDGALEKRVEWYWFSWVL